MDGVLSDDGVGRWFVGGVVALDCVAWLSCELLYPVRSGCLCRSLGNRTIGWDRGDSGAGARRVDSRFLLWRSAARGGIDDGGLDGWFCEAFFVTKITFDLFHRRVFSRSFAS